LSTSVTIRPAILSDVPAMVALLDELNRAEGYQTSISATDLASVMFGDDTRVQMQALVVENNAKTIAVALYYWGFDTLSASYGYRLADIVVTKRLRRKSIGKQLFKALAADCLQRDGQWISLTVLKNNAAAKKYYQSLGLTQVEVDFFAIGPQALHRLIRN
jgi:ribosomal protein S18 acetylase RimI-like enzyme